MEILLLGIYCFFVWLIFIKLKLLPWTTPWKVAVAIFPVVAIAILLLLLNVFAPTTSDVRVVKYVVPIVSQVRYRNFLIGRVPAAPDGIWRLVGAVRHLVHDRLRIRPDPGQWPEKAAEHQRQQTQRPNRLELGMMPLVSDLLGEDMHHPEQHDQDDRDDEQDEDGEESGELVFQLRREKRRVRLPRERQQHDQHSDRHARGRFER